MGFYCLVVYSYVLSSLIPKTSFPTASTLCPDYLGQNITTPHLHARRSIISLATVFRAHKVPSVVVLRPCKRIFVNVNGQTGT
jgi:hypothetical protein